MLELRKILKKVFIEVVNFYRKEKTVAELFLVYGIITVFIHVFLITTAGFRYPTSIKYLKEHEAFVLVLLNWIKYSQITVLVFLIYPIIFNYYAYKYYCGSVIIKNTFFPELAFFSLKSELAFFSLRLIRWHWYLVVLSFALNWLYYNNPEWFIFDIDSLMKEKQNVSFDTLTLAYLFYGASLILTSFNLILTVLYESVFKPESKEYSLEDSGFITWILCTSLFYFFSVPGIIEQAFFLMLHDKNLILVLWQGPMNYTALIFLIAALLLICSYEPSDIIKKKNIKK